MAAKGLFIVLLGPDGAGKTTVMRAIEQEYSSGYSGFWHFHWRPGLLPKLGRSRSRSVSTPGTGAPPMTFTYGRVVSLFRFVYYLADFIFGYWLSIRPRIARGMLIIGERWYYDVVVHPERYAFNLPRSLLVACRKLVPGPDVIVLLEGDPYLIHERKPELEPAEIERQLLELREIMPRYPRGVSIRTDTDISVSLSLLNDVITREGAHALGQARRDQKWFSFPSRNNPKVFIGSRDTVSNALKIYNPYSRRARFVKSIFTYLPDWFVRHVLLPRKLDETTCLLDELSHEICVRLGKLELVASAYPGTSGSSRKLTLQLSEHDHPVAYAKVSNTARVDATIANEIEALQMLTAACPSGICLPGLLAQFTHRGRRILVQSAPEGSWRRRSTEIDESDIRFIKWMSQNTSTPLSLDTFFSKLAVFSSLQENDNSDTSHSWVIMAAQSLLREQLPTGSVLTCYSHGDYTPWNTYALSGRDLYVFDWEYFDPAAPLFTDLLHRLYMPLFLLKKASANIAARMLIQAFEQPQLASLLAELGLGPSQCSPYVLCYLLKQADREYNEHGSTSGFTIRCLETVLAELGHPDFRRRILVSAYACEPDKGSEPGVGWHWVEQISRRNEVWVVTRGNNRDAITRSLGEKPNIHLHFVYVDVPRWLAFWKKGERGVRIYYYLWQFAAFFRARRLHRDVHFDLGHHVTFVNDYLSTFLCLMPMPYVWGPIGGNPRSPGHLLLSLNARVKDMVRVSVQNILRFVNPLYWISCMRASAIIAINGRSATATPLRWLTRAVIRIEPAIGIESLDQPVTRPRDNPVLEILFVGHFISIKGPNLVLEAFARFARKYEGQARLTMIGSGPLENLLRELSTDRGVADTVRFLEWMPRRDVLEQMRQADIFLFPSMESAGMVVLEAMTCGLPVVCLDFGGPATMVKQDSGICVPVGSREQTVAGLSDGLMALADHSERVRMGQNARRLAREMYGWDRKGRIAQELYDQCLKIASKCTLSFK